MAGLSSWLVDIVLSLCLFTWRSSHIPASKFPLFIKTLDESLR